MKERQTGETIAETLLTAVKEWKIDKKRHCVRQR